MDEAKWYVVHTYSGYENKVKANIEKTVENRNLQDQVLEVIVPLETVIEVKNGSKKSAQKKMFPGYVLINMVMMMTAGMLSETPEALQDLLVLDLSQYHLLRLKSNHLASLFRKVLRQLSQWFSSLVRLAIRL